MLHEMKIQIIPHGATSKMRRAVSLIYFCLFVFGALFAMLCMAAGFKHTAENISNGRDWWHHPALSNAGIGAILLFVTIAFAIVYHRRENHWLSPIAYVASYVTTGFMLLPVLFRAEKSETGLGAMGICAGILFPIIVTFVSLAWNYKRGRRTT